jgi:DNA-binding LacI/PurR family transcriptional regulator
VSKKPNIRDLARAAGVSTKTVSRVTNGEANVAAGTARRVQQAIEELGYAANPLARSRRTGRDEAIALVVTHDRRPVLQRGRRRRRGRCARWTVSHRRELGAIRT